MKPPMGGHFFGEVGHAEAQTHFATHLTRGHLFGKKTAQNGSVCEGTTFSRFISQKWINLVYFSTKMDDPKIGPTWSSFLIAWIRIHRLLTSMSLVAVAALPWIRQSASTQGGVTRITKGPDLIHQCLARTGQWETLPSMCMPGPRCSQQTSWNG